MLFLSSVLPRRSHAGQPPGGNIGALSARPTDQRCNKRDGEPENLLARRFSFRGSPVRSTRFAYNHDGCFRPSQPSTYALRGRLPVLTGTRVQGETPAPP